MTESIQIPLKMTKKESSINGKTYMEKVDIEILDILIEDKIQLLKKTFNNKVMHKYYENEKEQLVAYRRLVKKGFANVKYDKVASMNGWGRCNPHKGLGMYNIRREIRQTLAKKYYIDIDICNAHPTMLLQICKSNNITCTYLQQYIDNRDEILEATATHYNVSKESAKTLYIRLTYLGGFEKWIEDMKKNDANVTITQPTEYITNLKEELKKIGAIMNAEHSELNLLIEKNKKAKKQDEYNIDSSVMAYVLQEHECQVLETMLNYLTDKNIIVSKDCVLCADGIMIPKRNLTVEAINTILNELEGEIYNKLGFELKLKEKEMTQDYLEAIQPEIDEKAAREQSVSIEESERKKELSNKTKDEYTLIKNEVEKTYFFIEDLAKFGCYDKSNNSFIIKNAQSTQLCLAPHQYTDYSEKKDKVKPFFDRWIKDPTRRSYTSITFDPQNEDVTKFNLFTGFELERMPYRPVSTEIIHKMFDHILGQNKKYVLQWFAYILQKKTKTNVAIVLYSDSHGVGKNTLIEAFLRLIDRKYSSKLETIDELAGPFNSYVEGSLFMYGDEIIARCKDLYTFVKNTVTRTEVKINKKGIDSYKIKDVCNYMFTTNDPAPFKIEKKDRRVSVLQCNEVKLDSKEYSDFYEAIKNKDLMATFFNELMQMQIPDKIECVETELKNEIQSIYMSSSIRYLYENYKGLENKKYSVQEFFDIVKQYEKSRGYTELRTTKQLTLSLQEVTDFTFRTATARGYHFKNIVKHLKAYNNDLFEEYNTDYRREGEDLDSQTI